MIERMMAADLVHFALEDVLQRLSSSSPTSSSAAEDCSLTPEGTDSEVCTHS